MYNKCFIYFHCSVFWRASGWSQGEVLSVHCKCIISAGCWMLVSPASQGVDAAYKSRVNFPPGVNVAQPRPASPAQPSPAQQCGRPHTCCSRVSGSQPRAEPLQTHVDMMTGLLHEGISMYKASSNMPSLEAFPELIWCATGLRFSYVGDWPTGHKNWPFMVLGRIYGLSKFCQTMWITPIFCW